MTSTYLYPLGDFTFRLHFDTHCRDFNTVAWIEWDILPDEGSHAVAFCRKRLFGILRFISLETREFITEHKPKVLYVSSLNVTRHSDLDLAFYLLFGWKKCKGPLYVYGRGCFHMADNDGEIYKLGYRPEQVSAGVYAIRRIKGVKGNL